ncbi:methyltransferase [Streptomyces eurocidicus]|uniref:Methyltransferase n=1 Tax=Streptomyces eurocidicus TaxID=66423 RepID=A0A2N8P3B9_STREU|nr:methyltransferase [Streptomyces eurocidicus]MBB5117714.1 SAM-dependent methyltransferase [Streptomyces eurocidicus]MBF6053549.1 methyltransferase [Streptomyces eurocidicus]PNE35509.1 methyltransferase [Streptomyces eurocidicus]
MSDRSKSPHAIWAMVDLVTPMAIRVAATLRIADGIHQGRRTAAQLAAANGAHPDTLARLLRHLVTAGVLAREEREGGEEACYALTETGEALRDDHPGGVRALLDLDGAPGPAELSFVHLLHSTRTGTSAYPLLHGRPFWEDLAADPARTAHFNTVMAADARRWARRIAPAYDWGTLRRVLDVGGGDATLLTELLRAYPALRGTVLDQPATARSAERALAAAGLADRGDAVGGSFFDALPPGYDGYLLSAVLHDWDDDSARAVLRRCAEAAGPGGRVFVIENADAGADGESPNTAMDLRMLVYFGGRERGVAELVRLAEESGLGTVAVHRAADTLVVLELVPAR